MTDHLHVVVKIDDLHNGAVDDAMAAALTDALQPHVEAALESQSRELESNGLQKSDLATAVAEALHARLVRADE